MYQVIDTKTDQVLGEYLTFRTAEIKRNRQCFTAEDFLRYAIRYVPIDMGGAR